MAAMLSWSESMPTGSVGEAAGLAVQGAMLIDLLVPMGIAEAAVARIPEVGFLEAVL